MILCDTNILISSFNGKESSIKQLEIIGLDKIVISAITVMELLQGMGNRQELSLMKKKLQFYDVIHLNKEISSIAISLVEEYKLSHGLQIADAIIAASAIACELPLFTYNLKDFNFIKKLELYK